MCWPLIKFKRIILQKEYLNTPDSAKICTLKGSAKVKRCFIIGNGPSLKGSDLNRLISEKTFASNRIYEIFDATDWRPDFYFAIDRDFLRESKAKLSEVKPKLGLMFLSYEVCRQENILFENLIRILYGGTQVTINPWNDKNAHISEDASHYFSVGHTVTFAAIQMAIYMGFTEIYLLGCDFNYASVRDKNGRISRDNSVVDYFSGTTYSSSELNYYSTLYAYEQAKAYCDSHDIKIYNATRGGKLEVFPRVDFDSLFPPQNT